jgi:accessory colonization factor AcfC
MPNAKHKEKVKETSDILKGCREQIAVKHLQNYLSKFHQISYFMILLRDETRRKNLRTVLVFENKSKQSIKIYFHSILIIYPLNSFTKNFEYLVFTKMENSV